MESQTTAGIDFSLEIGGTVSGVVLNDAGIGQSNITVICSHYQSEVNKQMDTAADGSFSFSGLPPGQISIEINPHVDTGLVCHARIHWFETGQNKDLGDIMLKEGALITGTIQDSAGSPIDDMFYWIAENQLIFQNRVESDGSFQFRLPVGRHSLNGEPGFGHYVSLIHTYYGSGYAMMPELIEVTDVNQVITLSPMTGYDIFTGDHIWGNATTVLFRFECNLLKVRKELGIVPGSEVDIAKQGQRYVLVVDPIDAIRKKWRGKFKGGSTNPQKKSRLTNCQPALFICISGRDAGI